MSYSGSSACNGSHWGYREQESRRAYPIAYCGPNQSSHVILMTIQWLRRVCISFVSKKLSTNESIMEQRSPTPQICKKPMFSTRFLISTLFLYSTRPPLIEFCRTVMWISTLHEEASRNVYIFLSKEATVLAEQAQKNQAWCRLDQGHDRDYHPPPPPPLPSTALDLLAAVIPVKAPCHFALESSFVWGWREIDIGWRIGRGGGKPRVV